MQFFKPDILIRSNSLDESTLDEADADWDAAIAAYEARLVALRRAFPGTVQDLADMYLHDGEILMWGTAADVGEPSRSARPVNGRRRSERSVVAVKLDDVVTSITYSLVAPVRVSARRRVIPFTGRKQVDWLYDEVDVSPTRPDHFVHRVLLSDGREVDVPFASVQIQRIPLSPPSSDRIVPAKATVRRSA